MVRALLLAILASSFAAQSATWYVGATSAGANNGTSHANQWAYTGVSWGSVNAGDTINVDGGASSVNYTTEWAIEKSGTAGSLINIQRSPETSHNGAPTFTGSGSLSTDAGIAASGLSNVIFSGLVSINRYNTNNRVTGFGFWLENARNVVVSNCVVSNVNNGIFFNAAPQNVLVISNSLLAIRGDYVVGAAGSAAPGFDNIIVHGNQITHLKSDPGGPDGFQFTDGFTARYNTIRCLLNTNIYTSDQHPDTFQATGSWNKIYGNEFVNIGDSIVDIDCNPGPTTAIHDFWIYNNVVRIEDVLDNTPEFIRIYNGTLTSMTNFKVLNNAIFDLNNYRTIWIHPGGSPTGNSNELRANLFVNCGNGTVDEPPWAIDNIPFTYSHNVYYRPSGVISNSYLGATITVSSESNGTQALPTFESYTAFSAANDLRLASADTVAKDTGVDLSAYFAIDRLLISRPQGAAWDRGPFEFQSAESGSPRRLQGNNATIGTLTTQ